jgi:nucleotide-binding universal stress UspA family protein
VFTTIAWATDFSPSAFDALAVARRLAVDNNGTLAIIHVDESPVGRVVPSAVSNGASATALARMAEKLRDEGIRVTIMSSRGTSGDVARTIVEVADRAGADVIVAGRRTRSPLARLFRGNVAPRLLRTARVPVIVVPSKRPTRNSAVGANIESNAVHSQA